MKTKLLIDSDILLYQASFGSEHTVKWDEDTYTLHSSFSEAQTIFREAVASILEATGVDDYLMCLTSDTNWRKDIYPAYKANRANRRKPLVLKDLKDWVRKTEPNVHEGDLEADDLLGLFSTSPHHDSIVVSEDKDLLCIPGKHYNPGHPKDGVFDVSDIEADIHHMIQTLAGDPTDGYSGCPGIGVVKARRLIEDKPREEWWDIVVAAYDKAGLSEDVALTMARLAWIMREGDYDFVKHMIVSFWGPERLA